jgi:TRAP-type mannitol/chloroaromatic compound transport system permease small subunit
VSEAAAPHTFATQGTRFFAWSVVLLTGAYILNCYLTFWQDWPGVLPFFGDKLTFDLLGVIQLGIYVVAIVLALLYVMKSADRPLRRDSEIMNGIVTYIIRAAFYAVLFVGVVDMVISFLRVEDLLPGLVGKELAEQIGRPVFRGPYIHIPLILAGMVVAMFRKDIGFTWLALLVVIAELQIVLSRFIFAYEQAFMGDLVRFWYAALFLFASAYTLLEDGHVRVDVFYAGFTRKTRGFINAWGSVILGILFCWVILAMGMWTKSSIITTALRTFEVSQSGFGMYVKYLMAGFLGIFAVTMCIQFSSYLLESLADYRGDPGAREPAGETLH